MGNQKRLLNFDELIDHMKSKGIKFDIISEEEAKQFIAKNNYYMKLSSYRFNYEKCTQGSKKGQYRDLDFAYLKELSTIDMHLRYFIMQMCLDIEHSVKVKLMEKITLNEKEDGYYIVDEFCKTNKSIKDGIDRHKSGEYCKDLINKYQGKYPIWVFIELIPFSQLLYLCKFYEDIYKESIFDTKIDSKLMNTVRDIRNATAHSNCLINKLTERIEVTKQPNNKIVEFVKENNISKQSRKSNLRCKFPYHFTVLLFVYDKIMNQEAKKKRYNQLKGFLEGRAIKNKDYFKTNTKIVAVYNYLKKLIDNLLIA